MSSNKPIDYKLIIFCLFTGIKAKTKLFYYCQVKRITISGGGIAKNENPNKTGTPDIYE